MVPGVVESPESLLGRLQQLERTFGRQPKKIHNESRPLDLDLISFRAERRDTTTLILPHPRAMQRRFVLEPLAEIAPDLVLPGEKLNVTEQLERLRA
jgi:2-amino-4-hydroxy-6-hydroxymethyldihydropteridine diphosphokinase